MNANICKEIEGVGALCREFNALLMVDTVASLGAVPFFVDGYGVDACYTGIAGFGANYNLHSNNSRRSEMCKRAPWHISLNF